MSVTVQTVARPYNVFDAGGFLFLASSQAVQELIDGASAIVRATSGRVVLQDGAIRYVIVPATRGGGPAFVITKGGK